MSNSDGDRYNSPVGRWTVGAMFGFGILMVGGLWLYWDLYTRPFRELQAVIAERFPESSPRVIGGRHKSHKEGSPATLRIVVRVPQDDFDPQEQTDLSQARAEELVQLAAVHQDLRRYELLEVHLFQPVPEQETRRWSLIRPVAEWGISGLTGP